MLLSAWQGLRAWPSAMSKGMRRPHAASAWLLGSRTRVRPGWGFWCQASMPMEAYFTGWGSPQTNPMIRSLVTPPHHPPIYGRLPYTTPDPPAMGAAVLANFLAQSQALAGGAAPAAAAPLPTQPPPPQPTAGNIWP